MEKQFTYLMMLEEDGNHYRYFKMIPGSTTFHTETGRVSVAPVVKEYPMSLWDKVLYRKLSQGYIDRTYLAGIEGGTPGSDFTAGIQDPDVRDLIAYLASSVSRRVEETYSISRDLVTPAMISQTQELILHLDEAEDAEAANDILKELFIALPRRIDDIRSLLLSENPDQDAFIREREVAVLREQDNLDAMKCLVQQRDTDICGSGYSILERWGISCRPVSDAEEEQIIRHLRGSGKHYARAFRIASSRNRRNFDRWCEDHEVAEKDIHFLYHGSRNSNYLNILQNGLVLNPDAPKTGHMFGYGIYFAPKAAKSIGYTSLSGSIWAKGESGRAYLSVFKVAYRNPMHVHRWSHEMSQYRKDTIYGHDAVYAHGGIDLKNDEVIVYEEAQSTLQYLIELKS